MNLSASFNAVSDIGVKVLILAVLIALFPRSPFTSYVFMAENIPYLAYLNWFVPVTDIMLAIESWLLVISSYYSILFASRFVGIIKG